MHHEVAQEADFAIRTPNQTAGVRGTNFVIVYDPRDNTTYIRVDEGDLLVTPENAAFKPVLVSARGVVSAPGEGVKAENMPVA